MTTNNRNTTTRTRKRTRGEDPASKDALAQCAIEDSKNVVVPNSKDEPEGLSGSDSKPVRREKSSILSTVKHELLNTSQLEEIANMDRGTLESLMSGADPGKLPKGGESITGTIASVGEAVLVSLRGKFEGVIDRDELLDPNGSMSFKIGDKITAVVLGWEDGVLRLSAQLRGKDVSLHILAASDSGLPVEGKVVASINGGFHVDIGGTRAFCPISRIDRHTNAPPEAYVDQKFMFRIIEVKDKDVVVSRRELLDELAEKETGEIWVRIQVGQTHSGTVRNITQFGAFVEIDGIEGLIHISEISNERVEDINKHLQVGQPVTVKVLSVDPVGKRLSLTLKGAAPKLEGLSSVGDQSSKGGLGTLGDLFKSAEGGSVQMSQLFKDLK
jgi:predicted RNA-binding protein with RPS1 domain